MLKKLSDWIYAHAHGGLVLLFFGLQLTFSSFIFPHFQQQFQADSPASGVLDLTFGFNTERAYQILDSYGAAGREVYLRVESFWDVLYPLIYTAFFVLLISYLMGKSFPKNTKLRLLNLLPLFITCADFAENFGIVKLLGQFPNLSDSWVNFASTSGMIKWIFTGVSTSIALALLLSWLTKAVRRQ